ncbi:MAG: thiamine pyrophosphate-binding protein [Synergistaceae bacterium]|jgi:acetolactate synthase-1/2/3 large subunit|nr:thiamine pyrophosphate-binding protein [Synergistaceae bacterium]
MNAAKAMLAMLRMYGVTDVFGLPGETTLELYRAWEDFPDIAYHMCRDERSSVFMADGYAKATGRVGVCEGPSVGATHMVPGVVEAYLACVPMIVITSDVALDTTKKNMLTGFDQTSVFQGVTKETFTVTKASEIPFLVRRAFRCATAGRPGPMHLRIPMDMYSGDVPDGDVFAQPRFSGFPGVRSAAARGDVADAAEMVASSLRPVMICGQGCVHSGAWDAVRNIAEKANMPVGSTINAKGIFPETHSLSLGVIGARGGREWANGMVADADLIIFAGSSTDSAGTNAWKIPACGSRGVKMIQIDVSERELGNNYDAVPLFGDARETLELMLDMLPPLTGAVSKARDEWASRAKNSREAFESRLRDFEKKLGDSLHPYSIFRALERIVPDDAFFAVDPGVSAVYSAAFMRIAEAGRRTAYNFAMGALGYAIPAAIGARAGLPGGRPVIGLLGDGSFGFAAGELETASRFGMNIIYLIFDNRSFGWIRGTELVERKRPLPDYYDKFTRFAEVDYLKVAAGFGLRGYRAESLSGFEEIMKTCLATEGPKLVAIGTPSEDELLPPVPGWYKYASSAGMENLYGTECMG